MEGRISSALISVYDKSGLLPLIESLTRLDVTVYSTGGTRDFIEENGYDCVPVEEVTGYPSILGGRVKTLHPKIFGGILARRNHKEDTGQLAQFEIPAFDLVLVDLYPFEETVRSGASEQEIIEKIDVGGVSLIRAAAKNFQEVLVIPSKQYYPVLEQVLKMQSGISTRTQRREMMIKAFEVTSHYDQMIRNYFSGSPVYPLRYGENPHQKAVFYGDLKSSLKQLNGKDLSYNNLLDVESALLLMHDFQSPGFAIIKHNNACGAALDNDSVEAWKKALAGDPVSAFGGIIISNSTISSDVAAEIHKLFFEVLIALLQTISLRLNRSRTFFLPM
jgi:phosphoribosylaminoimidazolecarboxamide formyltransferase/IMP cyclohydrolase